MTLQAARKMLSRHTALAARRPLDAQERNAVSAASPGIVSALDTLVGS